MDFKKKLFNTDFYKSENYEYISKFFDDTTSKDANCMSSYNSMRVARNSLHFPIVTALLLLFNNGKLSMKGQGVSFDLSCSIGNTTDSVTAILKIEDNYSSITRRQMCVFNKNTHNITVLCEISSFNGGSIVTTPYHLYNEDDRKRKKQSGFFDNGLVIWLALLPLIIEDSEVQVQVSSYKGKGAVKLCDDLNEAITLDALFNSELQKLFFICNDNIYRRISQSYITSECEPFDVNGPDEKDLSVLVNDIELYRTYIPTTKNIFLGDFSNYTVTSTKRTKKIKVCDLPAKYNFGYKFSPEKEKLIPKLEDWYIIPKELEKILISINAYKNRNAQFQNILLYGRAGTGKSKMAEAIAYALQLPYYPINLNPNTDEVQLTGTYAPNVNGVSCSTGEVYIPTLEEINFDPIGAYRKLTGVVDEKVTEDRVYQKLVEKLSKKEKKESVNSDFIITQTPLVEAVRNGGLVELQELTLVKDPAMLGMLNSLMDCENPFLTVPQTGETIKRHPACVIIGTTNVDYAGCRPLNIATKDRFKLHFKLENPKPKDILERVKKKCTLFPDDKKNSVLKQFVDAFCEIVKLREANEEEDSATMRALYDWVDYYSALYGVITPLEASEDTIINRLSFDEEEQLEARAILQKYF